jgi:hypothetical protein
LPVRPPRAEDSKLRAFEPAEAAPKLRTKLLRPGSRKIELTRDVLTARATVERLQDDGLVLIEDFGWEYAASAHRFYSIDPDDPLSADARTHWRREYGRGDFRILIDTRTHMHATATEFVITGTLDAYEGETRVFSREWDCRVPRDHV